MAAIVEPLPRPAATTAEIVPLRLSEATTDAKPQLTPRQYAPMLRDAPALDPVQCFRALGRARKPEHRRTPPECAATWRIRMTFDNPIHQDAFDRAVERTVTIVERNGRR